MHNCIITTSQAQILLPYFFQYPISNITFYSHVLFYYVLLFCLFFAFSFETKHSKVIRNRGINTYTSFWVIFLNFSECPFYITTQHTRTY